MNAGYAYAIGAAVVWGLVYTIDQKILTKISTPNLLVIDAIVTGLIMLPFVLRDTSSIKNLFSTGKVTLLLVALTIILALVANALIFSSIRVLGASGASILEIAYPFFVVLFSYLFFRATPNLYFFIGGALIFAGAAVIIKFA